jgi:acyl-CoA dehydrogenase
MNGYRDRASLGYHRDIFSESHAAFRGTVRRFFAEKVEPNTRAWEKEGRFPRELFDEAGKLGMLCAGIPEEYGGMGGDFLHHVILHEEHGYSIAGAALEGGLATDSCAYAFLFAGTETQKLKWIPRLASGQVIAEIAISEAHSGSDVQAIRTTARRDKDDYLVSGHKMWVSNAPICDLILVGARVEEDGFEAGAKAPIQLLLVDARAPGVTISTPTELMMRGAGTVAEVFLDNVRIPADRLVGGAEGQGMKKMLQAVTNARLCLAARMMAACELALHLTLEFTAGRSAFGQRILDFQNSRFKLAELKTQVNVGRIYLDQLLQQNVTGTLDPTQAAMAKLWVSELESRVMDECLQLFGGFGFSNEYPISKMYTYARLHRLYLGTSEILKVMISRTLED